MIYLGKFIAGDSVKYRANFHNDQGTIEDPTSPEAQLEKPDNSFTVLTAPAKINAKTGYFGGAIDSTGFPVGRYLIREAGTVATAKTTATTFSFDIEAYSNFKATVVDLNADQSGVTVGTVTTNTDQRGTEDALLAVTYVEAPTVGEIDTELTSTHGAGSWAAGAAAPTVEEIDTELTSTHGTGSWQSSTGTPGVGPVTITLLDQFSAPVIGATVTITDTVGSGNYNAAAITDGDGIAIIDALATGDYFIVSAPAGYEVPDTAVTITTSAQSIGIEATKRTINGSTDPNLGTIYADIFNPIGDPISGAEMTIKATDEATPVFVDSNGIGTYAATEKSNSEGRVQLDIVKGFEIQINVPILKYERTTTLTTDELNIEDVAE